MCLASVLLLFLLGAASEASVLRVRQEAAGPAHDGQSWETAFLTLQEGLSAAQPGDEVWVAAGVYPEHIVLKSGVSLYGGFAGTEAQRAMRDWTRNATVLEGGHSAPVVQAGPDVTQTATLDGFTIRNGFSYIGDGPGITATGADVALAHDVITACGTGGGSGAIFASGGSLRLSDSYLYGNTTDLNGGGIASSSASLVIERCVFHDNNTGHGGAIHTSGGTARITDCLLYGNFARYGAAIACFTDDALVASNTIVGNASMNAGAVLASASGVTLANNIIAANSAGGISASASAVLSHNDVYDNTGGNYDGIPDPTGTNGNLSVDPLFVNRPGNDLHLAAASPCINAGDDAVLLAGQTDLEGNPRKIGAHVDIGAYELAQWSAAAEFSASENPHGVWSYGYGDSLQSFYPYGAAEVQETTTRWVVTPGLPAPNVAYDTGGGSTPAALTLLPGNQAVSFVRFTAPASGTYTVSAGFSVPNATSGSIMPRDVHLLRNGNPLWNSFVSADMGSGLMRAGFNAMSVTLIGGDRLDFAVGPGGVGDPSDNPVALDAGIRRQDVIIPTVYVSQTGSDANSGASWDSALRSVQAGIDRAAGLGPGATVFVGGGTFRECVTMKSGVRLLGRYPGSDPGASAHLSVLEGDGTGDVVTVPDGVTDAVVGGLIIRNSGAGHRGITVAPNATATVYQDILRGNGPIEQGGGIYAAGSCSMRGNLIVHNEAQQGSGIYASGYSEIYGNTIADNVGTGGAVVRVPLTHFVQNIVAFNGSGVLYQGGPNAVGMWPINTYNCIFGNAAFDVSGGSREIYDMDLDPLFEDQASGNYRLRAQSPCIDGGYYTVVLREKDLDGRPTAGSQQDIGAYEYPIALAVNAEVVGDYIVIGQGWPRRVQIPGGSGQTVDRNGPVTYTLMPNAGTGQGLFGPDQTSVTYTMTDGYVAPPPYPDQPGTYTIRVAAGDMVSLLRGNMDLPTKIDFNTVDLRENPVVTMGKEDDFFRALALTDDGGRVTIFDCDAEVSLAPEPGTSGLPSVPIVQGHIVAEATMFPPVTFSAPGAYRLTARLVNPPWHLHNVRPLEDLRFTVIDPNYPAYTWPDVRSAMQAAAGMATLSSSDLVRFDVVKTGTSSGRVDLSDADRIARKVAGLDPNPY